MSEQPPSADDRSGPLQYSLLYFFSAGSDATTSPCDFVLDTARHVDQTGFTAVWVPERHFHPFGGPFPSPSVLAGALAIATKNVRIRAGSVVLPLHDPLRVAEEWAMVDQLSGGRVDLAFAQGWNANDYVLSPDRFSNRLEETFSRIDAVQRLWRGEAMLRTNGLGAEVSVRTFPRPLQPHVDTWLTCTGGPERFTQAGERGYNVLTALLTQSKEELGPKIRAYREAIQARHQRRGHVSLMLHTFVAPTDAEARAVVQPHFVRYLESSVDLWKQMYPSLDVASLTPQKKRDLFLYSFERYFRHASLFGGAETCRRKLRELAALGVDEIACLIDFGPSTQEALGSLAALDEVRRA